MNTTTTRVTALLSEPVTYRYTCTEDGKEYRNTLPAGAPVRVPGYVQDGTTFVDGIARPTLHGGGVHVTDVFDPCGGHFVPQGAVVDAYVAH
jgi:hypothetical protein